MTNEEAIAVLKEQSNFYRKFQHYFESVPFDISRKKVVSPSLVADQHKRYADALDVAISALRSAPAGYSMTLEQLRQVPHGKINDSTLKSICERANEIANNPDHIDREAWVSEWQPFETIGGSKGVMCKKCGHREYDHVKYTQFRFCPECGRPMTPEALEILEKRFRG